MKTSNQKHDRSNVDTEIIGFKFVSKFVLESVPKSVPLVFRCLPNFALKSLPEPVFLSVPKLLFKSVKIFTICITIVLKSVPKPVLKSALKFAFKCVPKSIFFALISGANSVFQSSVWKSVHMIAPKPAFILYIPKSKPFLFLSLPIFEAVFKSVSESIFLSVPMFKI